MSVLVPSIPITGHRLVNLHATDYKSHVMISQEKVSNDGSKDEKDKEQKKKQEAEKEENGNDESESSSDSSSEESHEKKNKMVKKENII